MNMTNHVVYSMYRRFRHACKRLESNEREITKLEDAYFRYRDLLQEQGRLRDEIIKIHGVLGVHSPEVPKDFARLVSPKTVQFAETREKLKLWEVLELFLAAVDHGATVSHFTSFLFELDWPTSVTSQAVESAVRTHPELFEERLNNNGKFLIRRS